jgi:hypothetical protein
MAGVIGGIQSATSPWKENRMYRSKLVTMVATLAIAAGFSALAATAEAQISGTIGGDVVDNDALQVLGDEATNAPYVNRVVLAVDGGWTASWRR